MLSIKLSGMSALGMFKKYSSELARFAVLLGLITAGNVAEENPVGKFASFVINVEGLTEANKRCVT